LTVLTQVIEQAQAQSVPETIAVMAAIAYLAFAIRQQIICWLFAAISTAIYIWLFIGAKLYMESMLNVFYLVMAGYGGWVWSNGREGGHDRPVVIWPASWHLIAVVVISCLSVLSGYWLSVYSDAAFPYIDSMTTWFAIWATFLVARKVLENWWYWLLIDIMSIFIYWSRDLQLTAFLFVIYVIMIPIGLLSWRNSMLRQVDASVAAE
jgi:nicotinamide mononucleotide transporter